MNNKFRKELTSKKNVSGVLDKSWNKIWTKRAFQIKRIRRDFNKNPHSLKKKFYIFKIKFHDFLIEKSLIEYWRFIRNTNSVITKYLNVLVMIFIFFTNPKKLFRYSWRKALPPENMKDSYADNLFDLYKPKVTTNFNFINCNRRIYMRGYEKRIPKGKNIFLINSEVTKINKHCTFVSADESTINYFLENDADCIYIKLVNINNKGEVKVLSSPERISKRKCKTITLTLRSNNHLFYQTHGSGVLSIFAFSILSKRLKVYGWNFYKKKKLSSMNFIELIWNMFFYLRDHHTKIHVEYSLTQLFYAYYFDKLENLKVEGNLDYFKNNLYNKIITPKLKSIFLN